MPVPAVNTALFLNGTSLQSARPSDPQFNQRNVYKGLYKVHCMQYQAVVASNGIIVDFLVPLLRSAMTVTFSTKAASTKHLLKLNRDSPFSTSTVQKQDILCRWLYCLQRQKFATYFIG